MRTFMVGNLDNAYGNLKHLPETIKEAEEFQWELSGLLDRSGAEQVAEAYAERHYDDWEWPSVFDLIVWEYLEDEEGQAIPPSEVFRVKIQVRQVPQFHDSHGTLLKVEMGGRG